MMILLLLMPCRAKQQMKKHLFSIDMNALTGKTPALTREGLYINRNATLHPVL
jgi:hypothetical protein